MIGGPLNSCQEEAVESGVFALLERSGFRVMNEQCLQALEDWGCVVDTDSQLVKLPPGKTTEVITAAQKHYAGPDSHIAPPGTPAGGIQPLFRDRHGNTRLATTDDLLLCTRTIDGLKGITTVGPPLTNSEIDPRVEPLETLALLMKTCKRHISAFDVHQPGLTPYLVRLGEVYTGKPESTHFLLGIYCITTPLTFGDRVCRCLIEKSSYPVTVIPTPMPISGGNVPISPLAAIIVGIAEIIAGWAIALALNPELPLAGLICSGSLNMASGRTRFSSIEAAWQDAGVIQVLGRRLKTSVSCAHNYTDASEPGYPAVADKLFKSLTLASMGAGAGIHQGTLEAGRVYSNEQLAIDIELNDLLRRYEAGMSQDIGTMCERLIEVGPDPHYSWLMDDTTLDNMRKVQWAADLLRPECAAETLKRAQQKCDEALAAYTPPEITSEQEREIKLIVTEARDDLLC